MSCVKNFSFLSRNFSIARAWFPTAWRGSGGLEGNGGYFPYIRRGVMFGSYWGPNKSLAERPNLLDICYLLFLLNKIGPAKKGLEKVCNECLYIPSWERTYPPKMAL